jgi:predicted RNA binding protein YcfA (HicA-like mRNA interferase family)
MLPGAAASFFPAAVSPQIAQMFRDLLFDRKEESCHDSLAMKIRAMIKLIEADGWYLDRTRGSHRQYRHNNKKGVVTIAGKRE